MSGFLVVALAVFFDRLLGEPAKYHPLRGFAKIATYVEHAWHRNEEASSEGKKAAPHIIELSEMAKGVLALLILLVPTVTFAAIVDAKAGPLHYVFDVALVYIAIGAQSLKQHAQDVQKALQDDNLELAKANVSRIVSRDSEPMQKPDVILACVESVLENGNDAVFAPIFWYIVLGAPGVVLYRISNTLDSMWGYKNVRYLNFGWAAARLDDLLNLIPARLTAISYILLGDIKVGFRCLIKQGRAWYSPNAGPVMASGAGALNLEIGGNAYYEGQLRERPILGEGKRPEFADIARACDLVERTLILWLAAIFIISLNH